MATPHDETVTVLTGAGFLDWINSAVLRLGMPVPDIRFHRYLPTNSATLNVGTFDDFEAWRKHLAIDVVNVQTSGPGYLRCAAQDTPTGWAVFLTYNDLPEDESDAS